MEGDGRPNESGPSLDGGASYGQGPVTHGSAISPDRFDSPLYSHGVQPGPQRPRRPKLQHSQSILRKQAEEEAIKRSRSLSESYELSADLQDKQVFQSSLAEEFAVELVKVSYIFVSQEVFFKNCELFVGYLSETQLCEIILGLSQRNTKMNLETIYSQENQENIPAQFHN